MNRRDFIRLGRGLLVLGPYFSWNAVAQTANAHDQALVEELKEKDRENACQMYDGDEFEKAYREVNPGREPGILAASVGCRSPHKHLVFVPLRYVENPELIEKEADHILEDGRAAKKFKTCRSFDMSPIIAIHPHDHEIHLTREDMEIVARQPEGIVRIAWQPIPLIGRLPIIGGQEAGHSFEISLKNLRSE